ncbi:hypothetical protein [Frigoribacterium sp. Leaf186]|uniref:hypothetical protein n=1 Tax=Frigoribacterium sp. Leaf186 TaxID=1736293 RepID=UPI0007015B49|nr:hypothetical protein [Frigoribacterium sp. Leaf186]KQS20893.1 hypothetical protein ASG05_14720 [Frigoribacterium sp. Leaf186]
MPSPDPSTRRRPSGTAALTWGVVLLAIAVVGSPIGASVLLVGLVAPGRQSSVDVVVALVVVAVLVAGGVVLVRIGVTQRRRARLERVVDRTASPAGRPGSTVTAPPAVAPVVGAPVPAPVPTPGPADAPQERIAAIVADDPVALWRSAFRLEAWWFVDRGTAGASKPFAVVDEGTPTLLAFTSPERARDAALARGLDPSAADRIVWRAPADFVADVGTYTRAGLKRLALDPDQHGASGTLATLPEIARLVRR